jgi:hypothetical protein
VLALKSYSNGEVAFHESMRACMRAFSHTRARKRYSSSNAPVLPHGEVGFEGPRVLSGEDREAVESAGLLLCLEAGRPHKLVAEIGLAILDGDAGDHAVAVQECLFEAVALEHCRPIAKEGACAAQLRESVAHHAFSLSLQLHYLTLQHT